MKVQVFYREVYFYYERQVFIMKEYSLRQEVRIHNEDGGVGEQFCLRLSCLKKNANEAKVLKNLGETACESMYSVMVKEREPKDFAQEEYEAIQRMFDEME